MKKLARGDFIIIKKWIYRNARPLDLARWKYHFEEEDLPAVLEALAAYQNEDGGFGHALEADAWNPYSSPIQTGTAVERLFEVHFQDRSHPVVQGILKYLDSGAEMDGNTWRNVIASNNEYPHAPWWHTDSDSTARSVFNPTAILAGFILRFADRESRLYTRGLIIAKELIHQNSGKLRVQYQRSSGSEGIGSPIGNQESGGIMGSELELGWL